MRNPLPGQPAPLLLILQEQSSSPFTPSCPHQSEQLQSVITLISENHFLGVYFSHLQKRVIP